MPFLLNYDDCWSHCWLSGQKQPPLFLAGSVGAVATNIVNREWASSHNFVCHLHAEFFYLVIAVHFCNIPLLHSFIHSLFQSHSLQQYRAQYIEAAKFSEALHVHIPLMFNAHNVMMKSQHLLTWLTFMWGFRRIPVRIHLYLHFMYWVQVLWHTLCCKLCGYNKTTVFVMANCVQIFSKLCGPLVVWLMECAKWRAPCLASHVFAVMAVLLDDYFSRLWFFAIRC